MYILFSIAVKWFVIILEILYLFSISMTHSAQLTYIYFSNSLLILYALRYATERQIGQLNKLAATTSVVLLCALKVKGNNRSMEFKFSPRMMLASANLRNSK